MRDAHTDQIDVIYNDTCPICSREVAHYQSKTNDNVVYHGWSDADLDAFGLSREDAARSFHVRHRGEMVAGVEAFALLWEQMPRMRWLARFVRLPGVRQVAHVIYNRVLAPLLYALHKRRQAQACGPV